MGYEPTQEDIERELLEGQRRYREQMASAYAAGYSDAEELCMRIHTEQKALIAIMDETKAKQEELINLYAKIAEKKKLIQELWDDLENHRPSHVLYSWGQ